MVCQIKYVIDGYKDYLTAAETTEGEQQAATTKDKGEKYFPPANVPETRESIGTICKNCQISSLVVFSMDLPPKYEEV